MKYKIGILSQSHLCRNPRVLKEAITLSKNGYEVCILNVVFSKQLQQQDFDLVVDYPSISIQNVSDLSLNNFYTFCDKVIFRLGGFFVKYLKIDNPMALGYGTHKHLKKSKGLNADLYICHQELAAYTGTRLIKAGRNVAFDLEDWYSADLLPAAREKRPVRLLKKIEYIALTQGLFCTTTSHALADELARVYKSKRPEVIYNVFPFQGDLHKRRKNFAKSLNLFWFSQTIGPGRGIEEFIALLKYLNTKISLNLLGTADPVYKKKLLSLIPKRHELYFHDLVGENELAQKISDFDIGLALELDHPPSRNFTVTNKFFQYLQAGLPVIATETAGQKEIFTKFKPGFMLPQHPAKADIDRLIAWLNNPNAIQAARTAAGAAALYFSWDAESSKILRLTSNALELKNQFTD
ncbi:hypothetical protein [Mucilaginibacter flavidus]|uniref:hypothetical protein n=1 Tax=Mucilaginibacter flavidus TaxID=2949309 RepID=UPI0020922B31|nr:hypothetical protein [Mucilaginibacter flavidus]MCO5947683.1 hypothetical protein [Mucilaginibacter flavidus]